jgi:hypothetical protein
MEAVSEDPPKKKNRHQHAALISITDYETYNLDYVLSLAKRFYAKGYNIYLDCRECAPLSFPSRPSR